MEEQQQTQARDDEKKNSRRDFAANFFWWMATDAVMPEKTWSIEMGGGDPIITSDDWCAMQFLSEASEEHARLFGSGVMARDTGWTASHGRTCVVCLGRAYHACACRQVHYCSQECQAAHWATHRFVCTPIGTGDACALVCVAYLKPQSVLLGE